MLIELYSDIVCPWCFIGKRRLERALAMRPDITAAIKWRPFQLNPWMPNEGMPRAEYLTAKFGSTDAARIYDSIRRTGENEGLAFAFEKLSHMPNTLLAHCLVRWAERQGAADVLMEALFAAYFFDGGNIGEPEVLAAIAGKAGLNQADAAAYLTGGVDLDEVRDEDTAARQLGIQGVPCFIIDNRYAVSGAQESEYFMPLFDLAVGAAKADASLAAE